LTEPVSRSLGGWASNARFPDDDLLFSGSTQPASGVCGDPLIARAHLVELPDAMQINRRQWCFSLALWPQIAVAHEHARAVRDRNPSEWKALDSDSAHDIETLAAAIIPSNEGPGAREAGVIFFIDQALATFGADDLPHFRSGLEQARATKTELFHTANPIADLNDEQVTALMQRIEHSDFFELLRTYSVYGYLGNPSYGGNRDRVGWAQIGFEHRMSYSHPFGFYDAEFK
jgi:gluconate 2-dehydrogenase gamma chain